MPEFHDGISYLQLAEELGLDKSAANRRGHRAIELGYVKNLEDKKGKPARLQLGDLLPDETDLLPNRDDLANWQSGAQLHHFGAKETPLPLNQALQSDGEDLVTEEQAIENMLEGFPGSTLVEGKGVGGDVDPHDDGKRQSVEGSDSDGQP